MLSNFFGTDGFVWWQGVVEDRKDPLCLGRVRVRIFGWDKKSKEEQPTELLPWAYPVLPLDNGKNTIGLKEGDWVFGFFRDSIQAQQPVVVGVVPGIPENPAKPEEGFYDPTPDSELTPELQPRPPEMAPVVGAEGGDGESGEVTGAFSDPNVLPGQGTAFGELVSEYDAQNYTFDVNQDGKYDSADALLIGFDKNKDGTISRHEDKFLNESGGVASVPISRYPLSIHLKEPTTSRLARGEDGDGKIDETIVAKKKGDISTAEAASHEASGVGTDTPAEGEAFMEPATPFDAVYPYNHVYESESGHFIEIDDTPNKQRLHWYHRSGTFKEIHPDGQQVEKVKKKNYLFVLEDYFVSAAKSMNLTAGGPMRIKAGAEMNLNAGGNLNLDAGEDYNRLVKGNENKKVVENSYTVVKGDKRLLVEGNLFIACEGDIMIKAKGDFLVDAANTKITAKEQNVLAAGAAVVTEGPLTYTNTALTDGVFIHAKIADYATIAGTVSGIPISIPSLSVPEAFEKENTADNKDNVISSASSPKEGFLFQEGPSGDLYKPVSDSDGNAVVLSPSLGSPAQLYEARPLGVLEEALIQYKHLDGSITSWNVVRPKHEAGDLIDQGRFSGNGNGGRDHWRFAKPGSEYPSQMILKIGGVEHLIVNSSIRHERL